MSTFYKLSIPIVVLFLIAIGSYVIYSSYNTYQGIHSEERQQIYIGDEEKIKKEFNSCTKKNQPGWVGIFICAFDVVKSDQKAKATYYDLKTQQEMAEWTYLMLIGTWGTAVIAVSGIIFVWVDIITTRKIGQSETRAYVSIDEIQNTIENDIFIINVSFKNFGLTPAFRTFTKIYFLFGSGKEEGITSLSSGSVFPTKRFYCNFEVTRGDKDFSSFLAGKSEAFLISRVYYHDIFEHSRYTEQKFELIWTANNPLRFAISEEGNTST